MKKVYLAFLSFTVALLTLSCSGDDDGDVVNNSSNNMKVDDIEFELKAGVIEDFGSFNNDLYNFDITLISSDVDTSQSVPSPTEDIISGIYFELFSTNPDDLAVGEYKLVDIEEDVSNKTFDYAFVFLDLDVSSGEIDGEPSGLTSGSLNVISNAPDYEIEFSGIDSEGREISGNYKGMLSMYTID